MQSGHNNTVNLAQLASGTDGELFTWDTSGDPAKVAVGTATHVLTSNGTGAVPTFQAAAAGGGRPRGASLLPCAGALARMGSKPAVQPKFWIF